MRTPSASLAISTLALAVALTGTASATGLVDGHSIRNHSITANKLAKNAVTAPAVAPHAIHKLALADGVIVNNTVIAPAGPQGPAGGAGAPGVAIVDPSKITTAIGQDVTTPASSSNGSEAICPAGTYVIGGGYSNLGDSVNAPVNVIESGIAQDGSNGWYVNTHNFGGSGQTTGWHAIAYCAPAA